VPTANPADIHPKSNLIAMGNDQELDGRIILAQIGEITEITVINKSH
jgi:hypothetical protein